MFLSAVFQLQTVQKDVFLYCRSGVAFLIHVISISFQERFMDQSLATYFEAGPFHLSRDPNQLNLTQLNSTQLLKLSWVSLYLSNDMVNICSDSTSLHAVLVCWWTRISDIHVHGIRGLQHISDLYASGRTCNLHVKMFIRYLPPPKKKKDI